MAKVAFPLLIAPVPSAVVPSLKVTVPVAAAGEIVAVNVTEEPYVDGFVEDVSVTVVFTLLTVCVSTEEVLVLSFASPPYAAVIEFEPTAKVEMLNVAFPLLTFPVPNVVLPFLNVTVPVAVETERVAVNVTELPLVDGLAEEVSVTVGVALLTVCVNAEDVLLLSFASPP
jgi:hypothetical protein